MSEKHSVYIIKWRDAYSTNDWHKDDRRDDKDDIIMSAGFFLRKSKYYWFMCQSISSFGTVAEALAIPLESIISKKEIREE